LELREIKENPENISAGFTKSSPNFKNNSNKYSEILEKNLEIGKIS